MNRNVIATILFMIALFSLIYAIYRSTAQRITAVENGREIVYGEPQHGLILGLCIFSGFCIVGAVVLLLSNRENPVTIDPAPYGKKLM